MYRRKQAGHCGGIAALLVGLVVLLTPSIPAHAQDVASAQGAGAAYGLILYAQGKDFSVYRNNQLSTYDLSRTDAIGMPLFRNDLIQTDAGTYLEIQLLPSQSEIKVAENTTFRLESIGAEGQASIDLTYGRIRAKVEHIAQSVAKSSYPFTIQGSSVLAGVRGTDFGYDLVAERNIANIPITQVYCFEGTVEVSATPETKPGSGAETNAGEQPGATGESAISPATPQPVLIHANEMVSVASVQVSSAGGKQSAAGAPSGASGQSGSGASTQLGEAAATGPELVFQTDSVSPAIVSYWKDYNFKSTPIDPAAATTIYPSLKKELQREFSSPAASAASGATGSGSTPTAAQIAGGSAAGKTPAAGNQSGGSTTVPAGTSGSSVPQGSAESVSSSTPAPAGTSSSASSASTPAGAAGTASGAATTPASPAAAASATSSTTNSATNSATAPNSAGSTGETSQVPGPPGWQAEARYYQGAGTALAAGGILVGAAGVVAYLAGQAIFPTLSSTTQSVLSISFTAGGSLLFLAGLVTNIYGLTFPHNR